MEQNILTMEQKENVQLVINALNALVHTNDAHTKDNVISSLSLCKAMITITLNQILNQQ